MKIVGVSFERLDLELREPYVIAYEQVSKTVNFILRLETDEGFVGYGCGAPDGVVTNESAEQVEGFIKNIISSYLLGRNPFMSSKLLEEIGDLIGIRSSTLAMVDMALLDLNSKRAGVPLYQFLGGYRKKIATSITIGISSVEETLYKAREFVNQGFFILKIKGGNNLDEDIEKIKAIRQDFPKVFLRFDGNQGYTTEQAISFFKGTLDYNIEIFEQPTKSGEDIQLGAVRDATSIPVMADESLKNLTDAFRLVKNERIDMVNIKIMKVGGITHAKLINAVARAANVECMIGCIDECALGISAGLHFALSRPNIRYADLDGHLDIINDPFKDIFEIKKGVMYPLNKPGLGYE